MRYYNSYDYMQSSYDDAGVWVLMIYAIVMLVVGIFSLASYIIKGIGMYTIAKRQGQENPWLAFVPFARTYLHGELAGEIALKEKKIKSPGIWLLAMPFVYGAVFPVFYVVIMVFGIGIVMKMGIGYGNYGFSFGTGGIMGMIVFLLILIVVSVVYEAVYKVLGILVNRQIYRSFTSDNMSIAHAVLSAIVPLYESICMFVMRNRPYNPGMEPQIKASHEQSVQEQAAEAQTMNPQEPQDAMWKPVEEPEQAADTQTMNPQEPQDAMWKPVEKPEQAAEAQTMNPQEPQDATWKPVEESEQAADDVMPGEEK